MRNHSSSAGRGGSRVLARAKGQFAAWRRIKRGRERIPDPLWAVAVEAAREHGVNKTSRALRLNHSALQAEAQRRAGDVVSGNGPARFVELTVPAVGGVGESVVEAEDGHGAKLRVHLKGAAGADLIPLVRMLWGPDR